MSQRLKPATPPFAPAIQQALDRTMPPGAPPLTLFATLARDERLFGKFFAGGLLDKGHLTLRQREIVIHRVTAQCGSVYEFGVHVALFAARAQLDAAQIAALAHGGDVGHGGAQEHGGAKETVWSAQDRVLIRLCDALHAGCDVADALWAELGAYFTEEALLELLLLAGFYRTVSYLTNALRLPLEPFAAPFPSAQ